MSTPESDVMKNVLPTADQLKLDWANNPRWAGVARTYTAEDVVELSAHGSDMALARIVEIGSTVDARAALATLSQHKPDALLVTSGWGLLQARHEVMRFATQAGLPVIVDFRWPANIASLIFPFPTASTAASIASTC